MSKIPGGATHTFKGIAGVSYRRQAGERWEAYVDGDWVLLVGGMPWSYVPIQTETEWTGEGMPPVGVEIEVKHKDATPEWARPDFYKAEIVAIGKQLVIFAAESTGCETVGKIEDYEFRPVRTPEQIAAEKRDAAIKEMQRLVGSCNTFPFAALYDYGYRPQVEK